MCKCVQKTPEDYIIEKTGFNCGIKAFCIQMFMILSKYDGKTHLYAKLEKLIFLFIYK